MIFFFFTHQIWVLIADREIKPSARLTNKYIDEGEDTAILFFFFSLSQSADWTRLPP